ncbi:MAG TPA: PEP-CTERM sorting domain-containing protein [Gemmataceae bacterium]|nr:PEP-CTERM sorting domain-containing protein [Gemmataceae bacterium]
MIRRLTAIATLAVLFCAVIPSSAQQPLVYEFAKDTGEPTNSFEVVEGQTIRVRVYLKEREAGAPKLNSNNGLLTSAVRVTYGASSAATVKDLDKDVTGAIPPWADALKNGSNADSAVLNLTTSITATEGVKPTGDRVFLGTFTFTGNQVGTVNLTAADPNSSSDFDTFSFSGSIGYDPLIDPGTAVLTVVPVPEPATMLAVGAAGLAGLTAVRRRRAARASGP